MAGKASKETIERIRNSLDIVDVIGSYVQVKRTGNTAKALCPFHKEKTPSFNVNPARQAFHCFGCGAGGDVFKFVMMYENVDFPTALRLMASRAGVVLEFDDDRTGAGRDGPSKDELVKANEDALRRYHEALLEKTAEAEAARDYLAGRKLPPEAWKEWGIGYAPDRWGYLLDAAGPRGGSRMKAMEAAGLLKTNEKGNVYDQFRGRVMFAIRNEHGSAVGFSGRILKPDEKDAGRKYLNTPETALFRKSRILFGLDKAKREILDTRRAILCEGQIDCIRCHLAGFGNAVASQGTAFTSEHARLLKRYADEVLIVLDADDAGRKAALKTAAFAIEEGLAATLAALPAGEDPDSLILKGGAEAFGEVLAKARTPMEFLMELQKEGADVRSQVWLMKASRAAIELAMRAQDAVQTERMLREAAGALGVGYEALAADLRRARRAKEGMGRPFRAAEAEAPAGPAAAESPATGEKPVEEVELAILLCSRGTPELAGFVRHWLPYALVSDEDCRKVIHALAEEEPDFLSALDEEGETCKAFAARIANSPCKVGVGDGDEGTIKAAQDMVVRLWRRHLEGRRSEIAMRMRDAAGEARRDLVMELGQAMVDLGKLKAGWEAASRIIEIHLGRMANA